MLCAHIKSEYAQLAAASISTHTTHDAKQKFGSYMGGGGEFPIYANFAPYMLILTQVFEEGIYLKCQIPPPPKKKKKKKKRIEASNTLRVEA